MEEALKEWSTSAYPEIFGALLGFAYILLSIRQNILTWAAGLLSSLLYIIVFYHAGFYAGMSLQGYYVVMSVYGWYSWSKKKGTSEVNRLHVTHLTVKQAFWSAGTALPLFFVVYYMLDRFTDSPVPFPDAFTTVLGIVATWMLARKILFNWIIWIAADLCATGLYIWKEMWPTSLLYLVYSVLAVAGYFRWKASMARNS